mgnify:CR=1 FL=1
MWPQKSRKAYIYTNIYISFDGKSNNCDAATFFCDDGKNSTRHLRIALTTGVHELFPNWLYQRERDMYKCIYVHDETKKCEWGKVWCAYCLIFARVIVMKSSCFHFKKSKHHNDDNNGKIPHINNERKIHHQQQRKWHVLMCYLRCCKEKPQKQENE